MFHNKKYLLLLFALMPGLVGCQKQNGSLHVEGNLLPNSEQLHYRSFMATPNAAANGVMQSQEMHTVDVNIGTTGNGHSVQFTVQMPSSATTGLTPDAQPNGAPLTGTVDTDLSGVPRRADLVAGQHETIDLLPPPGTTLEVGTSWESAPPIDLIVENAIKDTPTVFVRYVITPSLISHISEGTLVRATTQAYYRMSYTDDQGQMHTGDVGYIGRGVVDLVAVPNQGWRVVRMTELTTKPSTAINLGPGDSWQGEAELTLDQLRAAPVQVSLLCLQSGSVTPRSLLRSVPNSGEVPEFQKCIDLAGGAR